MEVIFKIIRQNRDRESRVQNYTLNVAPTNTILDCLNRIKWELDGSLAFRKNCRNTICGSCGIKINGRSALACQENIGNELSRMGNSQTEIPEIVLSPLGNMPVIKDLVVDMSNFWNDLETVEPYVSTSSRAIPEREFLQTPEQRARLDQTGNCIMCGACYSECNAKEVNPEFVGPHALAKAQRILVDCRDDNRETRLEKYNIGTQGVWGCTRCYMCNVVCPMGVEPMEQISAIKQKILANVDTKETRSIRHRQVLVALVQESGWIDERKFGLLVLGNYFRDLQGLLSLVPLGWKMLSCGKFPLSFEPSEGTQEVRALIDLVKKENKATD
jgi:succinate dehydrogenase / fumarate reductase iron-sulfur subunit